LRTNSTNSRARGLKFALMLTTFLWTLLFPVVARAEASEVILKKGAPAPFVGVLVKEKVYRDFVATEMELHNVTQANEILNIQMNGLLQRETELRASRPNVWNWFLTGVFMGAVISFSASK
jgi:hypothetical protein